MTDNRNGQTSLVSLTVPALPGLAPEGLASPKIADQAIPAIGAYRTEKHGYYFNGQGPVPSVTTVLEIISKPAVGIYKAKEAARAIYRLITDPLQNGEGLGTEQEAIAWALKESDKARDTAADLGTSVHLLADLVGASESGSKGFEISDDEIPYIEAYRDFLGRFGRENIISSEHMVWSLNGYGGTYDLIMRIPCGHCSDCYAGNESACTEHDLWLLDIKTSAKGPYPEWGLQLAGYRWADYIILPGQIPPHKMPQVQKAGVLHLRPDLYQDTGWRLIEYPISYTLDYIRFLAA